jgi:hypothetical protein
MFWHEYTALSNFPEELFSILLPLRHMAASIASALEATLTARKRISYPARLVVHENQTADPATVIHLVEIHIFKSIQPLVHR